MKQEMLDIYYLIFMLLGIAALLVLRFWYAKRNNYNPKLLLYLSIISWIILAGGIMCMLIVSASDLIPPILVIMIVGFLIVAFIKLAATVFMRPTHRSQQYALLWSMAISAEKNIPLVPTIGTFAQQRIGLIQNKARKLAELLKSGVPLPDAIEQVPGILPQKVLPMIRVGYESGALAKALRQAVTDRDLFTIIWNSLYSKLLYIAAVISFGILILLFMFLRIIPSYEKIFRDFDSRLPEITRALISVSHFVVNYWFIFLPLYLLLIGLIVRFAFCPAGWDSFYLPGVSRLMRRRHSAVILDSLALAAECNQPLGNSVLTLAGTYPQSGIRRKLSYVGVDIHRGADWCESLYRHGLIKQADRAVLQAAQRVGNLPWAMREMADSNRRRLAYRLNALVQLAYPPVILCLGLIVMFIVVALFCPLISLIGRLTGL